MLHLLAIEVPNFS